MISLESGRRIFSGKEEKQHPESLDEKLKRIKEIVITLTDEQFQKLGVVGYQMGYNEGAPFCEAATLTRGKFLRVCEDKINADREFDKAMFEIVQASGSEFSGKNENWIAAVSNKRRIDAELTIFVDLSTEVGILTTNKKISTPKTVSEPRSTITERLRNKKEMVRQIIGNMGQGAKDIVSTLTVKRKNNETENVRKEEQVETQEKKRGLIWIVILSEKERKERLRNWLWGHAITDDEREQFEKEELGAPKKTEVTESMVESRTLPGTKLIQKYWESNAVGRWKKEGLRKIDVERRIKVLKALGAVSARHAKVAFSVAAVSGVDAATFLVRDRRGRLVLAGLAFFMFLVNNQDTLLNQAYSLSGGLGNIDLGQSFPVAHAFPDAGGIYLSVPQAHTFSNAESINLNDQPHVLFSTDDAQHISSSVATTNAPVYTYLPLDSMDSPAIGLHDSPTETSIPAAIQEVVQKPLLSGIQSGMPIEPQVRALAEKLPGDFNNNYYRLLVDSFNQFSDKFETTARAMTNASSLDQTHIQAAKDQLDAIAKLKQGDVDPSSKVGFDTLMKAMRYWR